MSNTAIIPFRDSAIYTTQDEHGQVWVAVRPICEHLEIDSKNQLEKLKQDDDFQLRSYHLTSKDGKQRQMMCLPQEQILGWLFTINSNRVSPEVKSLLSAYRSETTDAINDYWTKGIATRDMGEPVIDMSDPFVVAQLYVESEADRRRLEKENKLAHQEIELARPKVEAFESLINADGMCLLRSCLYSLLTSDPCATYRESVKNQ